jgi:hypothetical protein
VLVVGTDIPDMSPGVLQRAACALQRHDAVIGPAADGGYYLLGLRRVPGGLFEGVAWSTGAVCQQQVDNARRLGLDVAPLNTLPVLRDIDTVQDLGSWFSGLPDGQVGPDRTQLVTCARDLLLRHGRDGGCR